MTALLHPGVYVREVPGGARSIEGVATSTTIFVGETERGPMTPTKIRGLGDYVRMFGGHLRVHGSSGTHRVTMRYAIESYFANGGGAAYVLRAIDPSGVAISSRTVTDDNNGSAKINASSPGKWGDGVRVVVDKHGSTRLRLLVYVDNLESGETELVEDWGQLSFDSADENFIEDVLERSLYIRWEPGAVIDVAAFTSEAGSPGVALSGGANGNASLSPGALSTLLDQLDGIDDAALLVGAPDTWLGTAPSYANSYEHLRAYVDKRPKRDLLLIADLERGSADTGALLTGVDTITRSDMVAAYWPHLRVRDPVGPTRDSTIVLPPSGAVAGIYGRVDGRRGVFKAPAGSEATVNGIVGLDVEVLDSHQDELNPAGINAIRRIPGAGVVVWGARTLRPTSEWRYVPVRRMAMFLRKSIYNGIQWAVFEPNDESLWNSLRATIDSFMSIQFRGGAFAGASNTEAYFVKVDSETTTPADRNAGIVNILVGFAPLRPAEFVVVQLSQRTASQG